MATKIYYFTGKTKWCKVRKPDEMYMTYQVPLYMTKESWDEFTESGIQTKVKEDGDGSYTVFKRSHERRVPWEPAPIIQGPPEIFLEKDGKAEAFPEGLVGNGSTVTVKVEVYDTKRGKGHRLVSVLINDLVVYEPNDGKIAMPF